MTKWHTYPYTHICPRRITNEPSQSPCMGQESQTQKKNTHTHKITKTKTKFNTNNETDAKRKDLHWFYTKIEMGIFSWCDRNEMNALELSHNSLHSFNRSLVSFCSQVSVNLFILCTVCSNALFLAVIACNDSV